jgi:hypothetical protein
MCYHENIANIKGKKFANLIYVLICLYKSMKNIDNPHFKQGIKLH